MLLSEYPPSTLANTKNFPKRNRLISGLSDSIFVVEASLRSGSRITARYALETHKKVFCLPHSLNTPNSKGIHILLQKGAYCVTSPKDIFNQIGEISFPSPLSNPKNISSNILPSPLQDCEEVYHYISYTPISIETLLEKTKLNPSVVFSTLSLLELEGYIDSLSGNCYIRKEKDL